VISHSEWETEVLGRDLAATLGPGSVVLLAGELGAGKTAFVRGLAAGLGIDPRSVSSPTFTLIQEYRGGRLLLYHVDLYRLSRAEADDLGLEDPAMEQGVIAIEWPDRLVRVFGDVIRVTITRDVEDRRVIEVLRA
jgi:tRNA threonylcarbamoyladenosine biosynthesis protein TsaE